MTRLSYLVGGKEYTSYTEATRVAKSKRVPVKEKLTNIPESTPDYTERQKKIKEYFGIK